MKRSTHLGLFLVLLAGLPVLAADSGPGELRKVEVVPANGEIRVEITLSAAVTPSVETAQHPDRLVLKLPGTASNLQQKRIAIGQLGVRAVRFGLNRSDPPETHLVVDLDQEHPYRILTEGTRIILVVEAPLSASTRRRAGPAAAASAPLLGLGHKAGPDSGTPGSQTNSAGVLLTPPPQGPPIAFPPPSPAQSASTTASANPPSPQHPNRASLQEGTVFPSAGSPGAGVVPPVSQLPKPSGLDSAGNPVSANANVQPGTPDKSLPQEPKLTTSTSPEAATSVRQDSIVSLSKPSGQNVAPPADQKPAQTSTPQVAENVEPVKSVTTVAPEESSPNTPQETGHDADGTGQGKVPVLSTRPGENTDFRTAFRVKYVAQDAAYLDGGRAAGLTEGMKLVVRDLPNSGAVAAEGADSGAAGDVAELEVLSVAETSAVTEIHTPKRAVKVGDLAYLSSADQQSLVQKNALSATRKYPAVVSFTENDTLDDEARAEVPKPPLPSVNRARGRIGFDYIGVVDHGGSGMQSSNLGMVLRADITRINGTYWNVSGYWRGRFNSTKAGPQTLQDLINRTYHLYATYDNPRSSWVAGVGRMYLPWATSLDTIDGGYIGRKIKPGVTAGVFLGSTPDPTSYGYNPHREIGGAFVNFAGGSYDDLHYTSTVGGGLNMLKWSVDRPFLFIENGIFYKRIFSIYQSSQIDNRQGYWYQDPTTNQNVWQAGTGWGPGRSFTTIRIQPHPRVEFSFNHTYFRDLPTFDPSLIQTGLLDKYLMQGFSAGTRVEIFKQIWLSADLGLNNHTGEKNNSLNQMFGITFGRLPWINMHADARYTRFNSSFGSGSYEALSFSKNLGEAMQFQILAGQQNFASSLTSANHSRFVNGTLEMTLGEHYFIQTGGTINRGSNMNYDQWMFTFGYRFDNKHGHR
jgi:hypothetical protein